MINGGEVRHTLDPETLPRNTRIEEALEKKLSLTTPTLCPVWKTTIVYLINYLLQ